MKLGKTLIVENKKTLIVKKKGEGERGYEGRSFGKSDSHRARG